MSAYARNLNTFNDWEEPEYIPGEGDRVKLATLQAGPGDWPMLGTITAVCSEGDGDLRFLVELDEEWSSGGKAVLKVKLEGIEEVYA